MSIACRSVAALLLALVGCADDAPVDPPVSEVDGSVLPGVDPAAANCDPRGLDAVLEPSSENIARALQQACFHSGEGRRRLVIETLCQHELMCRKTSDGDCRANHEAEWQERLRPRGLSVPCMDALLDAMSCLAQASCGDQHACDAADERAETTCDPSTPLPGSPTCPPLPEGRPLTKGPIPDEAIGANGKVDESLIPDFIPAWKSTGEEIAGYVRYCAIHAGGAVPVYADDLKTLVGYMIPSKGFVPGPLSV